MAGLSQLVRTLSEVVPVRALLLVLLVLAVVGLPAWLENVRERQLRGAVRRMVRADPEQRVALVERVKHLAGGVPRRLTVLAGEAIRYDQRDVRDHALAALEAAGGDSRSLRAKIERPKPKFRDPVEAVVRVEGLLAEGLVEAAREQLGEALAAFPDDGELKALESRLAGPSGTPG
jgi:hypothetical protein